MRKMNTLENIDGTPTLPVVSVSGGAGEALSVSESGRVWRLPAIRLGRGGFVLRSARRGREVLQARWCAHRDDQKAREAGCDAYISKPIDTRKLPIQAAECLEKKPRKQ